MLEKNQRGALFFLLENTVAVCRVEGSLVLDMRQLPSEMTRALKERLTVPNPELVKAEKAGRNGFGLPKSVYLYEIIGDLLMLPRGAIGLVQSLSRRHKAHITWDSKVTETSERKVPIEDLPFQLRPYQIEALEALLSGVQGYIKAPCGSGKTVIGASALMCTGETGLILVHTRDLLDQWVKLFSSWECRVRVIFGGRTNGVDKPLTMRHGEPEYAVATVQSLSRLGDAAKVLVGSAGVVILDEAHHAPAATFRNLLKNCPARYRWGLTATPYREDGWGMLLPLVIGKQLWAIQMKELCQLGWLMWPYVIAVESGAQVRAEDYVKKGRVNIAKAVGILEKDPKRNALLRDLVTALASDGRTILLLVPRIAQAHRLASEIQRKGLIALPITSKVSLGLRRQRLRQMREGKIQVLIATQLADEGLDVPLLDALIVASTGRAAGRAVQRLGRVMRFAEGKRRPFVVDVVDPTPFRGQWNARAQAYGKELGVCPILVQPGRDPLSAVKEALSHASGGG